MRILFFVLLMIGSASAQQPAPYVPFTVDERTYNSLIAYLRQQPYMFAAPLMRWLEESQAAARASEAAEKKKAEEKPEAPK